MPRIEFFGGPKDGETFYSVVPPADLFLLMEGTLYEVDHELVNHPKRTIKYHKYELIENKYIYRGVI